MKKKMLLFLVVLSGALALNAQVPTSKVRITVDPDLVKDSHVQINLPVYMDQENNSDLRSLEYFIDFYPDGRIDVAAIRGAGMVGNGGYLYVDYDVVGPGEIVINNMVRTYYYWQSNNYDLNVSFDGRPLSSSGGYNVLQVGYTEHTINITR